MSFGYVHTFETPPEMLDEGSLKINVTDRLTGRPIDLSLIHI